MVDINQIMHLKEMICGDEDENDEQMVSNPNKGSVLNPGDIGDSKKEKDIAKPFAKINIKPGQKPESNPEEQKQQQISKEKPKKKIADKNDIWGEDEVKDLPITKNETRKRPEFDVLFKQRVGPEDVFLGLSGMDPTSTKCQEILIKIYLPDTKFSEISLDVTKEALVVQSTQYYLHHIFPYPVKDKEGKAQWINDKFTLQISIPIIREELY